MKNELAQLKADQSFKKEIFISKMRERITSMKNKEKPSDRRLRKSVVNKTQYLMRISLEQQNLQANMSQIEQLQTIQ